MYWLDTAIVAILVIGACFGALTGFLWQVARIACLGAALYCCLFFNDVASEIILRDFLQGVDPTVAKWIGYILVFVVVYLALYFVVLLLDQTIKAVHLETIDRVLGAAMGLAKMAVIAAAVCFGLSHYPNPRAREWMEQSTIAPVMAQGVDWVLLAIPDEYKEEFTNNVRTWWEMAREKAIQK